MWALVTPDMLAKVPPKLVKEPGSMGFAKSCAASFDQLDVNKDGKLTKDELRQSIVGILQGLSEGSGATLTQEQCMQCVDEVFDQNGDGVIDQAEFFFMLEYEHLE